MIEYWASTKAPVHLFKRQYESPEVEAMVRENSCVDASLLALELHISWSSVCAYQRRLGVRKISGGGR